MAMVAVTILIACQLMVSAHVQDTDVRGQLADALRQRSVRPLSDRARQLVSVEESLWPTFQALPKNQYGRIDHGQVGYAAQRYFARERGWRVEGLGGIFSGLGSEYPSRDAELTEALAAAMRGHRGGRGFSIGDAALLVSALEHYLLNDPLTSRYLSRVPLQRETCAARKETLMALGEPNTGRMPLRALYAGAGAAMDSDVGVSDLESPSFLRAQGAVHDSEDGQSHLRIANYMLLPSNCVSSAGSSISICCVSSCETISRQLEETLQGPVVSPERMLNVVSGLLASAIPPQLAKQLLGIAERHDGMVPLHSAAFGEWLHYAFPSACPVPVEPVAERDEDIHEAVQELRRQAASDYVPYTAKQMIADYAGLKLTPAQVQTVDEAAADVTGEAATPAAPTVAFSFQTAGRLAVLGLLAFAMLRTVVTQCRFAGGAMRGEQNMKDAKK